MRALKYLTVVASTAFLLAACGGSGSGEDLSARVAMYGTTAQSAAVAADYHDLLQRIYIAYFGRPTDVSGLAYWSEQYRANGLPITLAELTQAYTSSAAAKLLVDQFGTSQESLDLYGGDNDAFITAIYRNLFGRAPDPVGKAYWLGLVNKGAITRPIAALSIMSGAQSTDIAIINNKVAIASNFTAALNTPERRGGYDGLAANVVVRTLLNTVGSDTNVAGFQPSLETTITTLVATKASQTPVTPATPLTAAPLFASMSENVGDPSFALTPNGDLWGWGSNSFGRLGIGSETSGGTNRPIRIGSGYSNVSSAKGGGNTSAVKLDGTLVSWGLGSSGELGDGTSTTRASPTSIGSGFQSVSSGYGCSFAIKTDTTLWAWGRSCGANSVTYNLPTQIGTGFSSVASDAYGMAGIKTDGTLWLWGSNNHSRIRTAGFAPGKYKPFFDVPVQIGSNFKAVVHSNFVTIGLKTDGTLWGWGQQYWGDLGNGVKDSTNKTGFAYVTDAVQIGEGYTAITAGYSYVAGLKADGSLWTWGHIALLSADTETDSTVPRQLATGFVKIYAGTWTGYAIKADGSLWSWGAFRNGGFDAPVSFSGTPIRVN